MLNAGISVEAVLHHPRTSSLVLMFQVSLWKIPGLATKLTLRCRMAFIPMHSVLRRVLTKHARLPYATIFRYKANAPVFHTRIIGHPIQKLTTVLPVIMGTPTIEDVFMGLVMMDGCGVSIPRRDLGIVKSTHKLPLLRARIPQHFPLAADRWSIHMRF